MPTPIPPQPLPPKIPTGRELYDMLMAHIELELTSENAKILKEKYKNEKPEEREQRMRRYEIAVDRCQKAYEEYMETLHAQVTRYGHDALMHAELEDRQSDEAVLGSFDVLFQRAA